MDIFNLVFEGISAFNQLMMIAGGLVAGGIGSLLFGAALWERFGGIRVRGRVVGVRCTGNPAVTGGALEKPPPPEPPGATWTGFAQKFKEAPATGVVALLVALFVVGVPVLFIVLGSYFIGDYAWLRLNGVKTQGRVVSVEKHTDSEGGATYAPVFEYQDALGHSYRKKDRISSPRGNRIKTGTVVTLYYDPKKPEHFVMEQFWRYTGFGLAFLGIGAASLLFLFGRALFGRVRLPAAKRKTSYAKETYYPVFEYTAPDGRLIQSEDSSGSNWIADKIPGTSVKLALKKDDYESVSRPGIVLFAVGLMFAVPGGLLLYMGARRIEFNFATLAVAVVALACLAYRVRQYIKPRALWETKEGFRARMKQRRIKKRETGRMLTEPEIRERVVAMNGTARQWAPVCILMAAGMIGVGFVWLNHLAGFESAALRARGEVVRLVGVHKTSPGGGDYAYYPVIAFETAAGDKTEFRDSVGSNPPDYRRGDVVNVLYDSTVPERAMVDRGFWNKAPACGVIVLGSFFLWWMLKLYVGILRRSRGI